ncbi:MAG: hypothetical protein KatS3mg087_1165 [Patescibacteria group bacterium]|nr:MAG: hypothetical protein KatS3mg087_1165 [Patescibacteria group bacterium]
MKKLEKFEFGRTVERSKYDWDKLLSGEVLLLEKGKDFTCTASAFVMRARMVAKKKGLVLRSKRLENGDIVIQAVPRLETMKAKPTKAQVVEDDDENDELDESDLEESDDEDDDVFDDDEEDEDDDFDDDEDDEEDGDDDDEDDF